MSATSPQRLEDLPFLKRLAILLSRSLNTLQPNEVLAKTVFNLSKQHNLTSFTKAIAAFGRFSPGQAEELYSLCEQQDVLDEAFLEPGHHAHGNGLTVLDRDVLQPDAPTARPGLSVGTGGDDKHVFKAPSLPQRSALGLDRLAAEKRRERGDVGTAAKRIKYDEEDEVQPDEFKSEAHLA